MDYVGHDPFPQRAYIQAGKWDNKEVIKKQINKNGI